MATPVIIVILISNSLMSNAIRDFFYDSDKEGKCIDQCGGFDKHDDLLDNGEGVCSDIPENGGKSIFPQCVTDCLGRKVSDDQQKCLCELCKEGKNDHFAFCEKPDEPNIKEGECESHVCSGKAKYFNDACKKGKEYMNVNHFVA